MRKGQTAPRTVTRGLREKAWWCLRKNKAMTLPELLQSIHDGSHRNPETNLRGWLNSLHFAGILERDRVKVTTDHPCSNGAYRYSLAKDVGPLPPVWRKSEGTVLDPNSGYSHLIRPTRVKSGDL